MTDGPNLQFGCRKGYRVRPAHKRKRVAASYCCYTGGNLNKAFFNFHKNHFHSDQGCQYTSYVFRQILKGYHVEQSFSTPGQPHDNAVLETFFSAFKKEQVYRNVYRTKEELEASVAEYIEFYNEGRPHRKLNMKTPAQFEAEYFSALNTK